MTRPLEVYYYWNLGNGADEAVLERCLRLFLDVRYRDRELVKFEKYNFSNTSDEQDVIKQGLLAFNTMFQELKLKTAHDVWFLYIGMGNIQDSYKDVSVALLNQYPCEKKSKYTIYNKKMLITKEMSREDKLGQLKILNKILTQLFSTEKFIRYNRLNK